MQHIGDKIKLFRTQSGLSQQDLADKINSITGGNFKRATISNYENGVSSPSAKILKAISVSLKAPLNDLLSDDLLSYEGDLESFSTQLRTGIIKHLTKRVSPEALIIYTIILNFIRKAIKSINQRDLHDALKRSFKKNEIVKELYVLGVLDDDKSDKIVQDYLDAGSKGKK